MSKKKQVIKPPTRVRNRSVPPPPRFDITALPEDAILTSRELAGWLRLSQSTLEDWRIRHPDRGPPWVVVAGRPRYRIGDVRRWLLTDRTAKRSPSGMISMHSEARTAAQQ